MKVSEFMMNLQNQMKEEKKIAESTANQYLQTLWSLNNNKPFNNLSWLKKTETIDERLKTFAPSTQLNYLAVIVSALSIFSDKKGYNKIYNHWREKMNEMKKERDANTNGNEKTQKQEDNWINWDEVEKKKSELNTEISSFLSNKNITPLQYDKLLRFVILSLYTDIPPRRNEYLDMYVIKKVGDGTENNRNYYETSTKRFIFNVYKTAKKYGQQIIEIPDTLHHTLQAYLKHHPLAKSKSKEFRLLVKSDGSNFTSANSITRILNRIFGKNVGSSMLRHSYITSKYGDTIKELKDVAEDMGHTPQQQQGVYYKDS